MTLSMCVYVSVCVLVHSSTVDLTISLTQGEQCFRFRFNGNKQLRAQCLSSLFTTLQLNLISSRDLSLITQELRGKNVLWLFHELKWSELLKQANLQSLQVSFRLFILFFFSSDLLTSFSMHLKWKHKTTLEIKCRKRCRNLRKHSQY